MRCLHLSDAQQRGDASQAACQTVKWPPRPHKWNTVFSRKRSQESGKPQSQNQANTMHAKPNRDTVPQVINGRINGRFAPGFSGNPGGSPEAARKALNKDTILEMHRAFKLGGRKAIEEVMRNQPAVFLKLLVLLVPREMPVEHTGGVKAMTEDQIVDAIAAIEGYLARQSGEAAKVIEGTAEPAALPAPEAQSIGAGLEPKRQRRPNRLLMQADIAVGPRERKPRKREGGRG